MTALFLALSAAFAADPVHPQPGGPVPVPGVRGTTDAEATHPADGEHEAAEGEHEAGAHHVLYTADDDNDGVANWRDRTTHDAPNESSYVVQPLVWHVVNFTALVLVGVFFLRRPIGDSVRDRALAIRTELTDAAKQRDDAHRAHQELVGRLAKIEGEIEAMRLQADVDAKREEEQLVERAHREAARITEQTERNLRDETLRARNELRREAVQLAVKLAEASLRRDVRPADQQSLANAFLQSVNQNERRN